MPFPSNTRSTIRRAGLCVAFALLIGSTTLAAHAQTGPDEAARFQLADTYLRAGQFDRAIAILEGLYRDNPEYAYFAKLITAFESTKRYDDAITLIDQRIQREQNPVNLWSDKARILYLAQRRDEATESWQRAIASAPSQEITYRLVYQSVAEVREFEQAADILVQGRRALSDSTLFQQELGFLYGMLSEHEKAMTEYLGLIARDERQLSNVKSRLGRFADQPGVVSASVAVVERSVREQPLNRAFRELLGWLYLEAGLFRPALDTYRAIDRLESEQGRVLFTFAGQASAARAFDVALEAYKEILENHAARPIASEALRGKGEMHRRWAETLVESGRERDSSGLTATEHYALAHEAFEEYVSTYGTSPNLPYVLLDIALLEQEVFFRLEDARHTLSTLTRRFPNHAAADRASYQLGLLDLMEGDLDAARLGFARLEERLRTGDLAEQARFEIAMVHFYRGDFAAAEALISALKENTSNDTANDAISMRVLLVEGKGPDTLSTPLREFAHAHLLERQRQYDAALETLRRLQSEFGTHALADEALFQEALILVRTEHFAEAYQLFAELPLKYPTSHLADRGLFEAAVLAETRLGDTEKAVDLYTRLMSEFPGSLLVSEARLRIRALRGDSL